LLEERGFCTIYLRPACAWLGWEAPRTRTVDDTELFAALAEVEEAGDKDTKPAVLNRVSQPFNLALCISHIGHCQMLTRQHLERAAMPPCGVSPASGELGLTGRSPLPLAGAVEFSSVHF